MPFEGAVFAGPAISLVGVDVTRLKHLFTEPTTEGLIRAPHVVSYDGRFCRRRREESLTKLQTE